MDNHGMVFVYSLSGRLPPPIKPANSASKPETPGALDSVRSRAGIIDDFNSGLVNGWDSAGNRLGFITFADGKDSRVAISTTADYPALPTVASDNQVLKLDMNVKAWAGIIHHFENDRVDAWRPSDWRGYEQLSFWIHGRNRNTGLFIEILDNRKGDSGAEVFTHAFTDDFQGWKLISVGFSDFQRKDIGNNAPNDGLGLSEVHGWAFGALATHGPVTYYIDDIQLR